jgi:hypothetical protein
MRHVDHVPHGVSRPVFFVTHLDAAGVAGYSPRAMAAALPADGFEAIADAIMYRWSAERDVWVSPSEVEQARAYLERAGVPTSPLPDGRFALGSATAASLEAARVVLLGLRHLHATRRSRRPR